MAKKKTKNVQKAVKKFGSKFVILVAIFLFIGIAIGGGVAYFMTKDDNFSLVGEKTINLEIGDTYTEQGAIVNYQRKDISSDVNIAIYDYEGEIVENIDTSAPNEYSVVYTIDCRKWHDYKIIRIVIVGGGIDG